MTSRVCVLLSLPLCVTVYFIKLLRRSDSRVASVPTGCCVFLHPVSTPCDHLRDPRGGRRCHATCPSTKASSVILYLPRGRRPPWQ